MYQWGWYQRQFGSCLLHALRSSAPIVAEIIRK
uniref:Uncharacterized protein n=1 Tax=Arundo donax TaxID=35708 RepID=A0A0A9FC96_ARUDO